MDRRSGLVAVLAAATVLATGASGGGAQEEPATKRPTRCGPTEPQSASALRAAIPIELAGNPVETFGLSGGEWLALYPDGDRQRQALVDFLGDLGSDADGADLSLASGTFINDLGNFSTVTAVHVHAADPEALVLATLELFAAEGASEPSMTDGKATIGGRAFWTGTVARADGVIVRGLAAGDTVWLVEADEPALKEVARAVLPELSFYPPFDTHAPGTGRTGPVLEYQAVTFDGHDEHALDFNHGVGAADKGHRVLSSADGTVQRVLPENGEVRISHEGFDSGDAYTTIYAHMEDIGVEPGDRVRARELIGFIGDRATGGQTMSPHLHFQMLRGGRPTEIQLCLGGPDPEPVLPGMSIRGVDLPASVPFTHNVRWNEARTATRRRLLGVDWTDLAPLADQDNIVVRTDPGWGQTVPPGTVVHFELAPRLYIGGNDSGPAVEQLQDLLRELGLEELDARGTFGEKTRDRVMDFQRLRGIDVDGVVGADTWGHLLQAVSEQRPD